MNKAQFITLIENPKNLDKSHVNALKNIASDFPYFQANQMLLARALFNENHYEFEKQLRTTSVYVANREILYRFLHDQQQADIEETITETNINQIDVSEVLAVSAEFNSVTENVPEIELVSEQISKVQQSEIPKEIEVVDVEMTSHVNEVHSFSEWLTLSSGSKIINVHDEVEISAEKNELTKEPNQTGKTETILPSNIPQFESILDKFIRENPSISRLKAEFYNPANVAKQSVEEDEDLVTETLANIYYQQGAYKKAIRAYEKLCLIYPHKMSLFASLIQKIKDENKND